MRRRLADRGREPPHHTRFFPATWCKEALVARQLATSLLQCANASNRVAATLRGFSCHLAPQPEALAPQPEATVRRCTRGSIFAVIVDLAARFS